MNTLPEVMEPVALSEHTAAHLAELFAAFGDTSRVRIVSVLVYGRTPVSTIIKAVGLTKSAVSHHLRVLRQLHIVQVQKEGRQVYYTLDAHVASVFKLGLEHVETR
jgi:ArsR family transcriptional regulator, lead/cadmium/zinc/bismuth-responsive transcriptional repressor